MTDEELNEIEARANAATQMPEQIVVGYFLGLKKIEMRENYTFYRWIEHCAIAYKIENELVAHVMSPMGGVRRLSPYIFFEPQDQREMMKIKNVINRSIVKLMEPHNYKSWGIEEKS